ncbi:MAG: sulfotransferase family protein [Pseudoalteromonas sp.]|nr:sulfotransferase family protein [Pseudoalteromonas sp.]
MFNFSALNFGNLHANGMHQFCMNYAMNIFEQDAIYTFIPKNACSTLRLSVALSNGCIRSIEHVNWIHANNQTFKPSLKEAATAKYKFVVLRCPYRRLASVFLDKFVAKEPDAWLYRDVRNREVNLDDLTFEQFVKSLAAQVIRVANIHWRPQNHFLLYDEYDDYFALENFDEAITTLKQKINFDVVDARHLTQHGTDKLEKVDDKNYSQTSVFDIAVLKRQGKCPSYSSLFTTELVNLVKQAYIDDISLYISRCDKRDLLFN